jgi:hypothetical protein
MQSQEKAITDQQFDHQRKLLEQTFEQLKIIQESMKTTIEKLDKQEKLTTTHQSQFGGLFPQSHMQHKDAVMISKVYEKEKSVVSDFKRNYHGMSKNFLKWYTEYNTVIQKLAIRDKNKQKKDYLAEKYEKMQQEKF